MPNKNFIKLAKRQMNKEAPAERIQPTTPISQSSHLINNASYSFLEGDLGRQVLEEYNQIASKDYQGASALNVLSFGDNVVKGSNPFAFVLLNKILAQQKMRIASPADLERCLEKGELDLRGTYGDSGLVLRDSGNPNEYLLNNLATQINILETPVMIPLTGLGLKYDSNSPHDLVFQSTDFSEIIYAPQLNKTNHGKKFDSGDKQGLPIFKDNGSKTLYSNKDVGLYRLFRDWDLDLVAWDDDLAYSVSDGRVVVCAEGTSQKK